MKKYMFDVFKQTLLRWSNEEKEKISQFMLEGSQCSFHRGRDDSLKNVLSLIDRFEEIERKNKE